MNKVLKKSLSSFSFQCDNMKVIKIAFFLVIFAKLAESQVS